MPQFIIELESPAAGDIAGLIVQLQSLGIEIDKAYGVQKITRRGRQRHLLRGSANAASRKAAESNIPGVRFSADLAVATG